MGILDDAIREHLELKRKHGVPEDEVERQEEEALGPARRDVAQQPEDAEIAADAGDDASLFDGEHGDAPVAEEPAVAGDETAIAEAPAEAPADAPFAEAPVEAPAAAERRSRRPKRRPRSPSRRRRPKRSLPSQITRAWRRRRPNLSRASAEPPAVEAPPEPDPHDALGDTEPHGFPALEDDDLHEDDPLEGDSPRRSAAGIRCRGRRARRARGHARLPPGDAGARPALVRAEAAARLRLRLTASRSCGGEPPAPATPRLLQLSGVPCR